MVTTVGMFSLIYIAFAGATIWQMYKLNQKNYVILKTITSILFLVIGFLAYQRSGNEFYLKCLPAFILCFAGDVLLALAHEIDNNLKNPQFVLGVGSFLCAHIFFCWQFLKVLDWHFGKSILIALVMVVITILSVRDKKRYDYGTNGIPSIIYSFFVGLLCGLGLELLLVFPNNEMMMSLGVGGACFLVSDYILSQKYFRKEKSKKFGFLVLTFYYLAMWLLSTAILF